MAIPLNVNGAVFEYPETFDENWGVNATGWAQAVTNGMLQRQSASFPLLTDVNFGPTFGLLADHFQTRAANPASTGVVRLSKTDSIDWRNNANSADLPLTINGFDQLTFNGAIVSTSAAAVTAIIGTANEVLANGTSGSLQTGNVTLTTPQPIGTSSSPSFAAVTIHAGNLILTGLPGAIQEQWHDGTSGNDFFLNIDNGISATYEISWPSAQGAAGSLLQNDGAGNLSWSKSLSLTGLDLTSNPITSVANPTNPQDAATKSYVDAGLALKVSKAGDTMSGPLNMGANKITNLANGTVATDAAAFGQIPSSSTLTLAGLTPTLGTITSADSLLSAFGKVVNARVVQVVLGTSTTAFSTGSGTFVATNLSATITPQNAANHIIVLACGSGGQATAGASYYTLFRDGLNQFGGDGQCHVSIGTGTGSGAPAVIIYMVLAGSTSATTFAVAARVAGGIAQFGDGADLQAMLLIEVGA